MKKLIILQVLILFLSSLLYSGGNTRVIIGNTGTATVLPDNKRLYVIIGSMLNNPVLDSRVSYLVLKGLMPKTIPDSKVSIDINPNTINLKSNGKWITCFIEFDQAYDPAQIDLNTVVLNGQVLTSTDKIHINDHNNNGVPELKVKFDRQKVQEIIEEGDAIIKVQGRLLNSTCFKGFDTIQVINPGNNKNSVPLHVVIEAESCIESEKVFIDTANGIVTADEPGMIKFENIDFAEGLGKIKLALLHEEILKSKSKNKKNSIDLQLKLDSKDGTAIGNIQLIKNKNLAGRWIEYKLIDKNLKNIDGVHDLCIIVNAENNVISIDWIKLYYFETK